MKNIILMIIVCVVVFYIMGKGTKEIQTGNNFSSEKINISEKKGLSKKELEYYFYTQVPRSLHWNHHPIPDSKETRLAHFCGEKALFEAWSLSIRRPGKTYKDYLPLSTLNFMEENKNTPLGEIIDNIIAEN